MAAASAAAGKNPKKRAAARHEAAQRAVKHLQWAEQESVRRADEACDKIHRFFVHAKRGPPAFAGDASGFRSKWKLLVDYVPFTRGNRNREYLRTKFAEHVFSEAELRQAVEQAIRSYGGELRDVENQMLVKMRIDMADLPSSALPELASLDGLQAAFKRAVEQTQGSVGADVMSGAVELIAAEIATRIAVQVLDAAAAQLGVEGGLLGVGAASSWETFGVGLVVFWIIDEVWDWWTDPKAALTKKLDKHLDHFESLIVHGDGKRTGLREQLQTLGRERAAVLHQGHQPTTSCETGVISREDSETTYNNGGIHSVGHRRPPIICRPARRRGARGGRGRFESRRTRSIAERREALVQRSATTRRAIWSRIRRAGACAKRGRRRSKCSKKPDQTPTRCCNCCSAAATTCWR